MANETLKQKLEQMKQQELDNIEKEKIIQEIKELQAKQWEREHPRLANLTRFFGNSSFGTKKRF